jgi:hypothetical protein
MCVWLQEYNGHSAHVTNCCFMFNDKHLITVGGADRCVFQWRHLEGDEDPADRERSVQPLSSLCPPGHSLSPEPSQSRRAFPTRHDHMPAGAHYGVSDCADSDDEDNLLHDGGKGNKQVVMVQTGMASGESEFEPLNAMEGRPNPYKNHSLPELMARRGYKAPLIGRPVMGQMHVPSDFKVHDNGHFILLPTCCFAIQVVVSGLRGEWHSMR